MLHVSFETECQPRVDSRCTQGLGVGGGGEQDCERGAQAREDTGKSRRTPHACGGESVHAWYPAIRHKVHTM